MDLILVKNSNGTLSSEVMDRAGFKRLERVCGSRYVALGVYCEAIHQTMLSEMLSRPIIPPHAFCEQTRTLLFNADLLSVSDDGFTFIQT